MRMALAKSRLVVLVTTCIAALSQSSAAEDRLENVLLKTPYQQFSQVGGSIEDGLPLPVKPPKAKPEQPSEQKAPSAQGAPSSGAAGDAPPEQPAEQPTGNGSGLLGGMGNVAKPAPEKPATTKPGANTANTGNSPAAPQPDVTGRQQAAQKQVAEWRANKSAAWYKSGLPRVKTWLGASDWDPEPGDYFAAQLVYFALNVQWLDGEYKDRVKGIDAAAKSCNSGPWDNIDAGFSAGTEVAIELADGMQRARNDIVGDLQRSCNRLQTGLSLACSEVVPFDGKDKAVYKSLRAMKSPRLPGANSWSQSSDRDEQAALFRKDYQAGTAALKSQLDPEVAALDGILQARAKATAAALAKVGGVETKKSFLGLATGKPNPTNRTLKSKLQNIALYEKVMRAAAGHPDGEARSRWTELVHAREARTDCEVCWFSGKCQKSGSSFFWDYGAMPAFLKNLIHSVTEELPILYDSYHAEANAALNQGYAEKNKAIRDKRQQAYEEAKARNAEAQAKRGTPDDPDGKLADQAAAEEAKAKHQVDLGNCVEAKMKAITAALLAGQPIKSGDIVAECEAEIGGMVLASREPRDAKSGAPPLQGPPPSLRKPKRQPEASAPTPLPNPSPPSNPSSPNASSPSPPPPAKPPRQPGASPLVPSPAPNATASKPPQQLTAVAPPQGGKPAIGDIPKDIDTGLSPTHFVKLVREAMDRLGIKPLTMIADEPIYDNFSPSQAQKAGLDVPTAIIGAAFQAKVPAARLIEVLKLSRDDIAKSLDKYLQVLQGVTDAGQRDALVRRYFETG
jgi:hypothetical protein